MNSLAVSGLRGKRETLGDGFAESLIYAPIPELFSVPCLAAKQFTTIAELLVAWGFS